MLTLRTHSGYPHWHTDHINGFLRLWWRDPRLAHTPACPQSDPIVLKSWCTAQPCNGASALRVWTPNLFFSNALSVQIGDANDGSLLYIYSDGRVLLSQYLRLKMSCHMKFGKLPYVCRSAALRTFD